METDAVLPVPVLALPDDVLAAILRRLPTRRLATSRCVCKAWRDLIDERGLLQRFRRLLPHSVFGIFINYVDHDQPHFFARPTTSSSAAAASCPAVDGNFSYVAVPQTHPRCYDWYRVADHCNGLVLYRCKHHDKEMYVCNPTTRGWARLPQLASVRDVSERRAFVAFNRAVSRYYKVLVAPLELLPEGQPPRDVPLAGDTEEWPPSRWTWHEFSSRTRGRRRFEDGFFIALRYHSPVALCCPPARSIICSLPRLSLSAGNYSYHVIKSPIDRSECFKNVQSFLGNTQGEVYFVAIDRRRLRVWMLNDHESSQHDSTMAGSEWIIKHDRVLQPCASWGGACSNRLHADGPWILDDYYKDIKENWRKLDWSSDGEGDDIICRNADEAEDDNEEHEVCAETFDFLGFHPYKEVIFLYSGIGAVAYHLSSSKVQFLGMLSPYEWSSGLYDSFVYTACPDLRRRR